MSVTFPDGKVYNGYYNPFPMPNLRALMVVEEAHRKNSCPKRSDAAYLVWHSKPAQYGAIYWELFVLYKQMEAQEGV